MASLINDLISVLDEEKKNYENLRAIGEKKTKIIVSGEASELVSLTNDEQDMLSKAMSLDKKRVEIIEDIALVTNKTAEDLTISHLAELLINQKEEHEALMRLKDEIKEVVEAFKTINDRNKLLLQESLEYIDFTMNAISTMNNMANANYQSGGNIYEQQAGNRRFFDTKQ